MRSISRPGRVALVDAGHLPPLSWIFAGVRSLDLQVKGPALGVVPQGAYEAAEVALSENAMLVFYTDGVTEARSPAGQLFGDARLTASLSSAAGATADAAVRSVVAAVEHFANGAPQEDDVTMLALRWRGSAEHLLRDRLELQVRRALVDLSDLRVAVQLLDRIFLHEAVAAEQVDRERRRRVRRLPTRRSCRSPPR